ncbi:hypothetical protein FA15DRAFT_667014 [Coprinopsis marcescibilis]|uniref:Uncharacterized protein n=1 Tax=Coprinopsis marcescibilis TaxID=230819 RepID=A0A5C3L267_COPMA|nr:hypothetical protein FA15DRAFT_667014 [Coprinopsis marcescibilis]
MTKKMMIYLLDTLTTADACSPRTKLAMLCYVMTWDQQTLYRFLPPTPYPLHSPSITYPAHVIDLPPIISTTYLSSPLAIISISYHPHLPPIISTSTIDLPPIPRISSIYIPLSLLTTTKDDPATKLLIDVYLSFYHFLFFLISFFLFLGRARGVVLILILILTLHSIVGILMAYGQAWTFVRPFCSCSCSCSVLIF